LAVERHERPNVAEQRANASAVAFSARSMSSSVWAADMNQLCAGCTSSLDLAFPRNRDADPVLLEETKVASTRYLEGYLKDAGA